MGNSVESDFHPRSLRILSPVLNPTWAALSLLFRSGGPSSSQSLWGLTVLASLLSFWAQVPPPRGPLTSVLLASLTQLEVGTGCH